MQLWGVIGEFRDDEHDGVHSLTLAVVVTDGEGARYEVGRVAFNRELSRQPNMTFDDALEAEYRKAVTVCEKVNAWHDAALEREAKKVEETARRVRKILGEPQGQAA